MCRKLLAIIFSLSMVGQSSAQLQWPAITQLNKPWTRWWWQGSAVNKKDITAAMQKYQAAGLGGLELTPIYGVKGHEAEFIDFLSPKWMQMLQHTLQEGKRLQLGIDMANATGWPFGGPWVTPADACKQAYVKMYGLKTGESLGQPIRYKQSPYYRSESGAKADVGKLSYPVATNVGLQAYAFDQLRYEITLKPDIVMAYSDHGEIHNLTAKVDTAGKLDWVAPQGDWKIYALFTGFHGKMVERAAPGGEGDVIDHFSAKALQHYLRRFDSAFRGNDITGIRAFFNDSYEVDDARSQSNWTPAILAEFKARRGYPLENYLPQLFGRDSSDTGRRVLADYRQTISDLLQDYFTKPWQQWAAAKNKKVRNQSHGSPANILDLYGAVDIPETEGTDILRFKFATSAAHVMGKPLASSETATWLNEHFQSSLGDIKQAVDKYFIGGVNHVFWHGTSYSPENEPWPGWLFYAAVHFTPANPFWKDFGTLNNYVARCQSFLQKGKADNDVLLYFPFNDKIAEMGRDLLQHFDGMAGFETSTFKAGAEWMLQKGYGFDFVSDNQVNNLKTDGTALQTGGIAYKTIVLAETKYIPLGTMEKLTQLAMQGATVIFYKKMPEDVPGLGNLESRRLHYHKIIDNLSFAGSGIKRAAIGKGAFLLGEDLEALLREAGVKRESLVDEKLQYTRRSNENGHCYFISNPSKNRIDKWIELQVKEKYVYLYDPMTLVSGMARTKTENEITKVRIQLEPGGACILQTMRAPVKSEWYPYYEEGKEEMPLTGRWTLTFLSGGPTLPAKIGLDSLGSWTDLPGDDVKHFSGTAQYTTRFEKPSFTANAYLLDLGQVEETVEVILNGKKMATLLGPSFRMVLPASQLKEHDNVLELKVTNGMANRIADLDKRGVNWKKFYNTNFPARLAVNRNSERLFTAERWPPKASGLLGPVVIRALRTKNIE